jgi:hypothetical protein
MPRYINAFYALVVFLKKWASIKEAYIKNNNPIGKRRT